MKKFFVLYRSTISVKEHMLKWIVTTGVVVALVAGSALAFADGDRKAPVIKADVAKPDMKPLEFYVGSWTCDGKMPDPSHKELKVHSKLTFAADADLGGQWYVGVEKMDNSGPMPAMTIKMWMGWDAAGKKYVMSGFDSMGGWFKAASTGWTGDTMKWEGEGMVMGHKMSNRVTMTKKGDKEVTKTFEVQRGGQWAPMGAETCKK